MIGDFIGRLVLLVAPSGYGKSTAAAQACASPHRPAVWIELSPDENDPVAFCRTVLWALGTITPLDAKEQSVLVGLGQRVPTVLLPTITGALQRRGPLTVVLDDAHHVNAPAAQEVLVHLVTTIESDSRIVIASRVEPPIGVPRLRTSGDVLELGIDRLAMDTDTITRMAANRGLRWTPDEVDRVRDQTEGWPAGVALATMVNSRGGHAHHDTVDVALTGSQHDVAEYFAAEVLLDQPERIRSFLLGLSTHHRSFR